MKHSSLLLSLTAIVVMSCKPKQSNEATPVVDTSKPAEMNIMIPKSSCYSYTNGKDNVHLKVEIFPNVVTGSLSYNLHQKDSNKGEFDGHLHGDTLVADYTFMSEGKSSIRQVAFLIRGNVATEGYGNMEEKNGKMVFKDTKQVRFENGLRLQKIPCDR